MSSNRSNLHDTDTVLVSRRGIPCSAGCFKIGCTSIVLLNKKANQDGGQLGNRRSLVRDQFVQRNGLEFSGRTTQLVANKSPPVHMTSRYGQYVSMRMLYIISIVPVFLTMVAICNAFPYHGVHTTCPYPLLDHDIAKRHRHQPQRTARRVLKPRAPQRRRPARQQTLRPRPRLELQRLGGVLRPEMKNVLLF